MRNIDIDRYNPEPDFGLDNEQVAERKKNGLSNRLTKAKYKSVLQILICNVFSVLNIVCAIVAAVLIICQLWQYLVFIGLILINTAIGLIKDFKTYNLNKRINNRIHNVFVLRNGKEIEISSNEVVLDDIVILKQSNLVPAEGEIIFGYASFDESLLNGSSNSAHKMAGDKVLAESKVLSGYAKMKVMSVGKNSDQQKLYDSLNKAKRPIPHSVYTINTVLYMLLAIILVVSVIKLIPNIINGTLSLDAVGNTLGTMFVALPIGLLVMMSISNVVSASRLNNKNVHLNTDEAIEMLLRSDVLCIDKTGTITDASQKVKTVESLNGMSVDQIMQILSNVLNATKDNNSTAEAIKKFTKFEPTITASIALPFIPANKYSGASFGTKGTYIIGAIENLNIINRSGITYIAEEYVNKGYKALCLGRSYEQIKGNTFDGSLEPIALIVLEDSVKADIVDTFKLLRERNVEVKVVSGDDAQRVSEIAKSVGIVNADSYVSLEGKTDDEVAELALTHTIFGHATAKQKELIIKANRKLKKCVTMVGDGDNDVLALKSANCSIAMANGSETAKNVADIILLDSNVARISDVINEAKANISYLEKIASLFIAMSMLFVFLGYFLHPFNYLSLYAYELLCVILPSILLLLQNNELKEERKLYKSILVYGLPAGIIQIIIVSVYLIVFSLRKSETIYLDFSLVPYINNADILIGEMQISAMIMTTTTLFGLVFLYVISRPITKKRKMHFVIPVFAAIVIYSAAALISYSTSTGENNFLNIAFNYLTIYQWLFILMIILIVGAVYIYASKVYEFIKDRRNTLKEGDDTNEN